MLLTAYCILHTSSASNVTAESEKQQVAAIRFGGTFSADVKEIQTISIGEFFISEVVTCRASLSTESGSPIASLRPFCGCVTTKLSDPITRNGCTTREIVFVVKGKNSGAFRSKVEVIKADGTISVFLLQGEVQPLFLFEPSELNLSEAMTSREFELKCLDPKIDLEKSVVTVSDNRFVLSAQMNAPASIRFNLSISPEYKPEQLLSQRSLNLVVGVAGRYFSVDLPLKHKSKKLLIPATLTVDRNSSKATRFYLVESKAILLRATGRTRIKCDTVESEPIVIGTLSARTDETGILEFAIPWKDPRLDIISALAIEIETKEESGEIVWVFGGFVALYFQRS